MITFDDVPYRLWSKKGKADYKRFLIETPQNDGAHDRAMHVKAVMEERLRELIPNVPPTTDPCLASCFSKGAEAIFDKHGRHLVWSPDATKEAA